MWKDALLLTVSVVLFVQMGLSEAIQSVLRFKSRVLSCPRCTSFWTVLVWSLLHRNGLLPSVAASFLCSYLSLWLALAYDAVAVIYNKAYGKISTKDTAKANADVSEASADEVSEL